MPKQHSSNTKIARNWHNPFTDWQKVDSICQITDGKNIHKQISVHSLSIATRQAYLNHYKALCKKNHDFFMTYPELLHIKAIKLSKIWEQRKNEQFAAAIILSKIDLYMHSVSVISFIMHNFQDIRKSIHIADYCQTLGLEYGRTNEQMLYNFSCYKIMGHCKGIKNNFRKIPLFCGVISPKLLAKRSKILKKGNKKLVIVSNLLLNYYRSSRHYRYHDASDKRNYLSELLLAEDLFEQFGKANHAISVSEDEIDEAIRKSSFMVDQQQPSEKPKKRKKKSKKSKKSRKSPIQINQITNDDSVELDFTSEGVNKLPVIEDGMVEMRDIIKDWKRNHGPNGPRLVPKFSIGDKYFEIKDLEAFEEMLANEPLLREYAEFGYSIE